MDVEGCGACGSGDADEVHVRVWQESLNLGESRLQRSRLARSCGAEEKQSHGPRNEGVSNALADVFRLPHDEVNEELLEVVVQSISRVGWQRVRSLLLG